MHAPAEDQLPYIDEHAIRIPAPREQVWNALQDYVDRFLNLAPQSRLARILGTQPPAGFEVASSTPVERLALVGRHRFARYALVFELSDAPQGATQLRAQSYAEFPGLRGRAYRTLVIGSRAHILATNHILRTIRRRCLGRAAVEGRGGPAAP